MLMPMICQPGQRLLEQAQTPQSSWLTLLLAGDFLLHAPLLLPSFNTRFQGILNREFYALALEIAEVLASIPTWVFESAGYTGGYLALSY